MMQTIEQMRQARGWTVRELAARVEIDHRQLSRYEKGTRGLPWEHRESLAREFLCHPGDIDAKPANPNGRPRRREADLVAPFLLPASYNPTAGKPLSHHLPAARNAYPALVGQLEQDTPPCRRLFLDRARGDSGLEATGVLQQLCLGAGGTDVAPLEVGFTRFPVVDRETEKVIVGHCKVPALITRDWLMIPQVTVATPRVYRMDGLVVVTNPIRTFIDLEWDGLGHNNEWDRQRTRAIGLPTLRLTEADVLRGLPLVEHLRRMGYCLPRGKR